MEIEDEPMALAFEDLCENAAPKEVYLHLLGGFLQREAGCPTVERAKFKALFVPVHENDDSSEKPNESPAQPRSRPQIVVGSLKIEFGK